MVGAGFSRNAESLQPDIEDMPTWCKIAESMCEKLINAKTVKRQEFEEALRKKLHPLQEEGNQRY